MEHVGFYRLIFVLYQPLKWELKYKPGMSPPRGGFRPDDPNQQIVAEDIFDEYGGTYSVHYDRLCAPPFSLVDLLVIFLMQLGFLSGGGIPDLLADFSARKSSRKRSKKKSKHKDKLSKSKHGTDFDDNEVPMVDTDSDAEKEKKRLKRKGKNKLSLNLSVSYHSDSEGKRRQRRKEKHCRYRQKRYSSSSDHSSEDERTKKKRRRKTSRHINDTSSDDSCYDHGHRRSKHR